MGGWTVAYAIEPDGSLTCRGRCTAPYDAGTCFVLPDPNGRNLFWANYLSGSVACCALLDDGRLAAACRRERSPKGAVWGTIGRRAPRALAELRAGNAAAGRHGPGA